MSLQFLHKRWPSLHWWVEKLEVWRKVYQGFEETNMGIEKSKIDGVLIKKLNVMPDDRGWLTEILRNDDDLFEGFGQIYMSATRPGVVKAFHYHEKQYDNFVCLSGTVRLVLYDKKNDILEQVFLGDNCPPLLIRIPPFIHHGWKCISETPSMVINICSQPYDYSNPDEIRAPAHGFIDNFTWDTVDR